MTAEQILSLLESDPAAGILATADLIEQRANAAMSDVQPGEESWFRMEDKVGLWAKFAELYDHAAPHIVSWSPAPALAVAAWLRGEVRSPSGSSKVFAFCRAYLSGAP